MLTASDGGRELAVLGSPIAHSQSPALHSAAYRVLGLPWAYGRDDVTPSELPDYVASRHDTWRGLSLTMPLKQSVLSLVDSLDETARLTGAANTVLFETDAHRQRLLRGFNTDVPGIVRALGAAGTDHVDRVLIFGGGATAASAVVAAAQCGAESVTVQVREPVRASHLAELGSNVGLRISVSAFGDHIAEVPDLVVSTLPGDAGPEVARRAVRGEAVAQASASGAPLLDAAYDPWPTPIVTAWDAIGAASGRTGAANVLSGLAMLVHQALLQVRIFALGDPELTLPSEPDVLAAMLNAVGLDDSGRRPSEPHPS